MGAATLLPQADAAPMRSSGKRVAVFGGGMSGLTAAHELVERGFRVDVFDSRDRLGGKARSFGVPGSRAGGPAELPAEHGFRFFPGFYRNVPESMRRIPRPGGGSVVDNLRGLDELAGKDGFGGALSLGTGQSSAGFVPLNFRKLAPVDPGRLTDLTYLAESFTQAFRIVLGIPLDRYPLEMADFTRCVLVYLTSCLERRQSQWDSVSWWNFLDADNKSAFFRNAVVKATTMDLVAVKPEVCSVYSAGNIVEAFLWNVLAPRPGPDDAFALRFLDPDVGVVDRPVDRPTGREGSAVPPRTRVAVVDDSRRRNRRRNRRRSVRRSDECRCGPLYFGNTTRSGEGDASHCRVARARPDPRRHRRPA